MNFTVDFEALNPALKNVRNVISEWSMKDYMGTFSVRWGFGRDNYSVSPGVYKIGNPDANSDVFVSANYKLSFDVLRRHLKGINAWILVIDTKGVNVWCAAGKGTFGTETLVRAVKEFSLGEIVSHRKLIVPQLGAPGIAAHKVKEYTGFRVVYGPVRAQDIKAFVEAGYKSTPEMRRVTFPIFERAKLIPVDFMYGKYKLLIAVAVFFLLSGLDRQGLLFGKMLHSFYVPVLSILGGYVAGIVLTPLLLPILPFRYFSLKGVLSGLIVMFLLYKIFPVSMIETLSMASIGVAIASFTAMNFTGSSTYTSLSGVIKEMKWSIPFQIAFSVIGVVLFITSKLI